ncbi:hypothetical protein D081_1157 [Anaerovibrio sp. JC8]|nr:hypothetical protein D081_1157 [Anaerovibrio sp. JC8]
MELYVELYLHIVYIFLIFHYVLKKYYYMMLKDDFWRGDGA